MKKNKTMRAAGGLLIATLLTTSIVSGTYAKYVTEDSGSDTARVAKFGVVASVSGNLFGDSYSAVADDNSIQSWEINKNTVSADTKKTNVVAPGTKNDKGLTLSVTGTPEVSTKLILEDSVDPAGKSYVNTDIELKAGTYGVMVEYKGTVTTDTVTDYYTLNGTSYTKATASTAVDGTVKLYELKDDVTTTAAYKPIKWKVGSTEYSDVAAVKTAIAFSSATADPNKNLSTEYGSKTITWEWPFEVGSKDAVTGLYANDKQDTILGDLIADAGDSNYQVVKMNGTSYDIVKYAEVNAAADSANKVQVAYIGDTEPTIAADANVAVLTVSFGARLTVEQVD